MSQQALPHQKIGARFLSERTEALLADAPRVGKTGSAIMAADDILAEHILVVTTASGRAVWDHGFRHWSIYPRSKFVLYDGELTSKHLNNQILVISWAAVSKYRKLLTCVDFDLLILDESHYAKSTSTKRTKAVLGTFSGDTRVAFGCIQSVARRTWCLTGTPIPNAPNDLYPMMRALCPDRLLAKGGWPDVTSYEAFERRYCIVKPKRLSRWNTISVVVGGRNLEELRARLDGFWLRRKQKDVGITEPIYDILPIHISDRQRRELEADLPAAEDILDAAETGETRSLDMHLGTLRRVTGRIKAAGVVQTVNDDFDGGVDKVVIMCWHRDTMDAIEAGLSRHNPVRVDGSTLADKSIAAQRRFSEDPTCRVFVGQIIACGEAIDLSASSELIFAESSFVPKDMSQAALRITNLGQRGAPRVRVAALAGSIDEALQQVLMRKIATNKEVLKA